MSDVVRPFVARVVRSEYAVPRVRPLVDSVLAAPTARTQRPPVDEVEDGAYLGTPPGLFVYRLRHDGDEHVGVVADVGAQAFVDGQVRGHEAVQPARVEALVEHFAATDVRSELVSLLHEPVPAVARAVAESMAGPTLSCFTGEDGWEQSVWLIPHALSSMVADALGARVHYIADGHHRVAANLELWRREGRPPEASVLCVLHPLGGLRLRAFDRRVRGPVDTVRLDSLLAETYRLRLILDEDPQEASDDLRVYADGAWRGASRLDPRPAGVAGLDITVVDRDVIGPLLGDQVSARVETTPAIPSLDELTGACDRDGGVAFALRPPTLAQLVEVADRGEVMPPKTTYFAPKPYAGVILR